MIGILIKLAVTIYVASLVYRKIRRVLTPIKSAHDAYQRSVHSQNSQSVDNVIEICPECGVEMSRGHKCQ